MSTSMEDAIILVKNILKDIEKLNISELKKKYGDILKKISPFEITLIEQQLIREGFKPEDILRMCDLHVELFREYLESIQLRDVPENHPLNLLMLENQEIVKLVEALNLYAETVIREKDIEGKKKRYESLSTLLNKLKDSIRKHYRKNQMLIFPYLERRGIYAVPRVLWGKEEEVIKEIRELLSRKPTNTAEYDEIAGKAKELGKKILDLVFRENKILYPATWVLLEPGEWKAVDIMARELGYIVEVKGEWGEGIEPIYPYMVDGVIPPEKYEKLPIEIKRVIKNIKPDNYVVAGENDIEFSTGFLSPDEVEEILRSLPLELTYADKNDRIKFYTKSKLVAGFPRTKTIIGRKLEYCHPPRLEKLVKSNVELLKKGEIGYRVFWTRMGDRILRVLIVGLRGKNGEYMGTLEVVEDFTDVIKNPKEIMEKIVVL